MSSIKTRSLVTLAALLVAILGSTSIVTAVPVAIGNSSFEVPELSGSFAYQPAGATWSFTGLGGISGPPSGFGGTPAPDGDQYAFLQTAASSFFQEISIPADGMYVLSFFAAGRPPGATFGGTQTYRALLDSEVIFPDTTTDQGNGFVAEQSAPFFATAAAHTLTFQGLNNTNDQTAFIDAIAINSVPSTGVPEPSSLVLMGFGAAGFAVLRRRTAR